MIKTINITGETVVDLTTGENNSYFSENKKYCRIDNKSENNVYVSLSPNVAAGKDGVLEISTQSNGTLELTPANKIYVSGSGKIQIQTSSIPLKTSTSGGGGGEAKQLGIYPIQPDGTYSGEITLPDTMTSIPQSCFKDNKNLTKVNLPDSIVNINDYAFSGCSNMSIGTCNVNNVNLGAECFKNSGITNENVNYLSTHCVSDINSANIFAYCPNITDVSVDLKCGYYMLQHCENLENAVVLSCSNDNASRAPFAYCTKLKRVAIPLNGFEKYLIDKGAYNPFIGCIALEEIVLPEGWNHPIILVTNSFTHDGLVNMINALADLTGETSLTFTLGSVNLAKLSEEEKAIAANKNWVLA